MEMNNQEKNPDATVNSVRKVVVVKIDNYPLVNELIKKGWFLLKVTDVYYVLGNPADVTIPELVVR